MNIPLKWRWFGVCFICVAATAIARDDRAGVKTYESPAPQVAHLYRASRIIGVQVRDAQDRKIGEVKDLILGSERGEIAYAVIRFGSGLQVGTRYHAVPWQALEPVDDGGYYVLHADRQTISEAPGFDSGKWPDLTDREWRAEVDRYWNRMVGRGAADNNRLSSGVSGGNSAGSSEGTENGGAGR
jgi:hypothetical protein